MLRDFYPGAYGESYYIANGRTHSFANGQPHRRPDSISDGIAHSQSHCWTNRLPHG